MVGTMTKIHAKSNDDIVLKVIPGHYATSQSHITHYLDMTTMKTRCAEASRVAKALSQRYELTTPIDTIVCLDGLEVIGAFLAQALAEAGVLSMNAHKTIYVVSAEFNTSGQMIFRDNIQPMIKGKNVVVLIGSITTGATLQKSVESILYYGGVVQGVSAVFSAVNKIAGMDINAIYYKKDIPNYESYAPGECPACKRREKIDAIVNSYGYSKL